MKNGFWKRWKNCIKLGNWRSIFVSKENRKNIKESKITSNKLGGLLDLVIDGTISNRQAKEIFEDFIDSDEDPRKFIQERGLVQLSDMNEIENLIKSVLQQNPKMVEDYKNGKEKLFGFFVGQVMKVSEGKANPKIVNETLKKLLK